MQTCFTLPTFYKRCITIETETADTSLLRCIYVELRKLNFPRNTTATLLRRGKEHDGERRPRMSYKRSGLTDSRRDGTVYCEGSVIILECHTLEDVYKRVPQHNKWLKIDERSRTVPANY